MIFISTDRRHNSSFVVLSVYLVTTSKACSHLRASWQARAKKTCLGDWHQQQRRCHVFLGMKLQLEWLLCTTYELISFQPEKRRDANCRVADPATSGSSPHGAVMDCGAVHLVVNSWLTWRCARAKRWWAEWRHRCGRDEEEQAGWLIAGEAEAENAEAMAERW